MSWFGKAKEGPEPFDATVATALLFCAAACTFKLFLTHFLTARTRMMLTDPYGKADWSTLCGD